MAALFASSSHPSLFSPNPRSKTLRFFSPNPNPNPSKLHRLYFITRNPRLFRLSVPSASPKDRENPSSKPKRISDEWGEREDLAPEPASEPDPPNDDDEWGEDSSSSAVKITDEWGEKADPEPEPASEPDPPRDEDEWGEEEAGSGLDGNGSAAGEPETDSESEKLGDLKRCLVDTLYGTDFGLKASAEVRAEIFELVSQLEAENPTPAPNEAAELLDGNWILL